MTSSCHLSSILQEACTLVLFYLAAPKFRTRPVSQELQIKCSLYSQQKRKEHHCLSPQLLIPFWGSWLLLLILFYFTNIYIVPTMCQTCSKHFTNTNSFNPHSISQRFVDEEIKGTWRISNLLKGTWPSGRTDISTSSVWLHSPWLSTMNAVFSKLKQNPVTSRMPMQEIRANKEFSLLYNPTLGFIQGARWERKGGKI